MPLNPIDGGLPSEHLETLHKAAAYRALAETDGYHRLLDFLEAWANAALETMRAAGFREDDRTRANMQLIWAERENALAEIQREVQRGIAAGRSLAEEIDPEVRINAGLPMEFSDND